MELQTNISTNLKEFIFHPSLFAPWGIKDSNALLAHPVNRTKPMLNQSLHEELNFPALIEDNINLNQNNYAGNKIHKPIKST